MKYLAGAVKCLLLAPVVICLWLAVPSPVEADIYKYVDKTGVLHFTNVPTSAASSQVTLPPLTEANFRKYFPHSGGGSSFLSTCNLKNQNLFDPHIRLTSQRYGLDCNLIKAMIRAESGFDPNAISPKGAMGLMQLMPGTARDLSVYNPFDPMQNIDGGARYIRFLLDRFNNNLHFALAAYNAGPESVSKHKGIPPYDETQVYVRRVMDFYNRYRY
jgi:hypothetical protein